MKTIKFRFVFKHIEQKIHLMKEYCLEYWELDEVIWNISGTPIEKRMYELARNNYALVKIDMYIYIKDKNEKEIYERDIVGNKDKYGNVKTKCVIEWGGGHKGYTFFAPINEFEVIGNIYENPELVEDLKC